METDLKEIIEIRINDQVTEEIEVPDKAARIWEIMNDELKDNKIKFLAILEIISGEKIFCKNVVIQIRDIAIITDFENLLGALDQTRSDNPILNLQDYDNLEAGKPLSITKIKESLASKYDLSVRQIDNITREYYQGKVTK